jgi:fructokinase
MDMEKSDRVVCFGEALIDMLAQPPADDESPNAFLQFAGGAPANVSVAVARLGGDSHFVGMLGEDMFGDFLLRSLQGAGVSTDGIVRTDQARTALAFVALDEDGERSFSFYRPPSADILFRPHHFDQEILRGASVFHVCSNSMTDQDIAEATYEGMQRARAMGATISFDINLRPMLWPEGADAARVVWGALALSDVVKVSKVELDWLCETSGDDIATVIKRLWEGHAQLLVVTDGDNPIVWHTRTQSAEVDVFRVLAQDTTAAGDAFVGGFLFKLARSLKMRTPLSAFCEDSSLISESLRFAAAVGALAVTKRGAFAAMPTLDEVNIMINEQI